MKSKYIVLRDGNQPASPTSRYSRDGAIERPRSVIDSASSDLQKTVEEVFRDTSRSGRRNVPPDPRIEVHEVEPREIAELARDVGAKATAREMPISMIEVSEVSEPSDSDQGSGPTWGIREVAADKCKFVGDSATVAVIDSGIRKDHVAFRDHQLEIVEQDFTSEGGDTTDQSGHGTHCAATILGRDVKGRRIGVAPGIRKLLVARIFASGVTTTTSMLADAMQWAARQSANIISMSLTFNFTALAAELQNNGLPAEAATAQALVEFQNNLRLFDSLTAMFQAQEQFPNCPGVVIVGAAGNHSRRAATSGEATFVVPVAAPSNALRVISVGALQRTQSGLGIAPTSNSRPTFVAPGFGILSADFQADNQLAPKSGTSMAGPHVAGLAALWWDAVNQSRTPLKAQTVVARLQASCRTEGLDFYSAEDYGAGIPQAPQ